jgi:hypothetical protein
MKKDAEMTTPKIYAERHGVHYTTVMSWLRRDLVPGVVKEELPYGGWYYRIPVDAPLPELKPGRPSKNADSAKGQTEQVEVEDVPAVKPAKTARKKSSKK